MSNRGLEGKKYRVSKKFYHLCYDCEETTKFEVGTLIDTNKEVGTGGGWKFLVCPKCVSMDGQNISRDGAVVRSFPYAFLDPIKDIQTQIDAVERIIKKEETSFWKRIWERVADKLILLRDVFHQTEVSDDQVFSELKTKAIAEEKEDQGREEFESNLERMEQESESWRFGKHTFE